MRKYSISQKWINILISCLLFLIIYSIIYSVLYIHVCIENEKTGEELRYEYEQVSQTLLKTSDYMTEAVRNFVVTDDFGYLDDYWKEVQINKNREKVIEKLNTMKLSESEKRNVSLAKEYSDYLMDTELKAMKLIIESLDIYEDNMPEKLLRYKLNVVDENLSNTEKREKALEILFNQEYLQGKKVISDSISKFQESINSRMIIQMNTSMNSTMEALTVQTSFLIISFVLVIVVLIIFYKSFMLPIRNYTNILNDTYSKTKEYNLEPEGSKELRMLAERFNILYEDLLKANNAKSEFLATMSHEIRTPLNTLIGYNQVLENTELSESQKRAVSMSKFAAKNLMNTINNILDFSKLENNKFELENIVFDLNDYLMNIRNVFLNEVNKRGLYFKLEIEENMPRFVYGDMTKLNQILMNIISNALKFIDTGGIKLSVYWRNIDLKKIQIKFNVEDTGIGIKKEKIEHIFESFEQSNASITRKYGGTGLGLAISKKLASLFEGDITVKSTYGLGSTFSVVLNLQKVLKEQGEQISQENYTNKKVHFNKVNVLIVDDNEINRIMEKELLEYYGFKLSLVSGGIEAVNLCREKQFDLILMDIRMGGMDGYEATRNIRKKGLCRDSYIIALSADGLGFVQNRERNLEMDDFIAKPIDINLMISKLKNIFKYEENLIDDEELYNGRENSFNIAHIISEPIIHINYQKAIYNLDNNKNLYIDILNRFIKNYSETIEEIKLLIENRDYLKVNDIFHVLKGISGYIGAENLYDEILRNRKYIEEKDYEKVNMNFEVFIRKYQNTYVEVYKVLDILKKDENIIVEKNLRSILKNTEDNEVIIKRLIECLEEGSVESIDLFNENIDKINKCFSFEKFQELKDAIETYNMEYSLKILKSR